MFVHRTLALLSFFYRSVPIPILMIHNVIMSTEIGSCGTFSMNGFWAYFTSAILVSMFFGFYMGITIWRKEAKNQLMYAFYNSFLSGANFVAWSLIRPKPLSCFEGISSDLAPIIFGIVSLVGLFSSGLCILRYNNLEIKTFVRWKIPDFGESAPYNDLF